MKELLSVSEARKLTGKSESTIKRMIREITADQNHEDRGLIEPSHEELERRKAVKEPYVWKIAQALLEKRYPVHDPDHVSGHDRSHEGGDSAINDMVQSQLIELLQTQIKTLEVQLDRKDEQISNANKRTEEIHVLMQTLQKHLALPPVKDGSNFNTVDATSPEADAQTANAEVAERKPKTFMDRLRTPIQVFPRK
jgi:hypothetical protein